VTIRGLVWLNILWNCLFVLMAASEMTGLTSVHGTLPWYLKWWWICGLAGGNLVIHWLMLSHEDLR
jgi:hypothetical protein